MLAALKLVALFESVMVPLFTHNIDDQGVFRPNEPQETHAKAMLDSLVQWTHSLAPMRG